ncbi:LIC11966 family surface protein [Hymenobacter elongatus]|uniref:DUF3829 domain-containing protein n=1 Tax=Hymenobacter elongatus TaxID=877208 RepID=A0A4Z0PFQ0_9BACT|nr:hypothetical protein [Hymenobacter elongatus]TGE13945.1 hypothetical protein E5J99_18305 [Hymenobacter elongatus]
MRISTVLLVSALLAGVGTASAQTFTDPGAYNNFIIGEQRAMLKKNLRYISKSAHSDNEKKIDAKRLELVKQTEVSLQKLARLPAFQDDKGFKDQTTEAFYQQLKVYSEDYKAVDMMAATRTASVENMEHYLHAQELAEAKLQAVNDSVNVAQARFAKRHKMTMGEDPEGKRLSAYMRQVSEVNTYQHQVFLAQFRTEKAIAMIADAMRLQNAAEFEVARVQLQADTKLALEQLAIVPAFRGKDAQYRDAARNLVKLYNSMCTDQFVKMQDLMERKDQLTKADVDSYNKCISFYNTQNQKAVEAYNRAGSTFMAAYVPVFND